jgi:15-cis-phytoene synthase
MGDQMLIDALQKDFAVCRAYTRHFAKTFYFASHVLPREKRMAAYALYAFCRYADEIVDSPQAVADPELAVRDLEVLCHRLKTIYSGGTVEEPKLRAFQATVQQYRIPVEYFIDLIRGVEMDLMKRTYRTFGELEEYCYCVASTVGMIMTKVFGAAHENEALEHAIELGKAMQLTNILRDVGEDCQRGRIYLPEEDLRMFGVTAEDLSRGDATPAFVELMKFQIRRARSFFRRAESGIPELTDDGSRLCVRLMSHTYAEILDVIETNGYDSLSRRAFVPLTRKIRIAYAALRERTPAGNHGNVHVLPGTVHSHRTHHTRGASHVL